MGRREGGREGGREGEREGGRERERERGRKKDRKIYSSSLIKDNHELLFSLLQIHKITIFTLIIQESLQKVHTFNPNYSRHGSEKHPGEQHDLPMGTY